jgi:ABC-type antimicrobial peptide transport system permease subunit
MHKRLGDTLDYTDELGRPFQVRLVATLAGSILQGDLLIAARHFEQRYPSESGYRRFLIDAPPEGAPEVAAVLSEALADVGLEVTPAAERLREFNAVQNTYLLVFQLLGGLGVLLGTAGLGMVVLRNAMERRAELAVLRAVGFPARAVRRLVFSEHALLLALGLGVGTLAAALALAPTVETGRGSLSAPLLLFAGLALSGAAWVALATRLSLRGRTLDALRSE